MGNTIFLIKDEYGKYIPYVNGHGIKLLPSEVTQIIQDLTEYGKQSDVIVKFQNMRTEQYRCEEK